MSEALTKKQLELMDVYWSRQTTFPNDLDRFHLVGDAIDRVPKLRHITLSDE